MSSFPPQALQLCRHLEARPGESDPMGMAWYPECHKNVWLHEVFTNMLNAMQEAINDHRR